MIQLDASEIDGIACAGKARVTIASSRPHAEMGRRHRGRRLLAAALGYS